MNNEVSRVYRIRVWVSLCLCIYEMCCEPLIPCRSWQFDGGARVCVCIVRLYGHVCECREWDKEFEGGQLVGNKNILSVYTFHGVNQRLRNTEIV